MTKITGIRTVIAGKGTINMLEVIACQNRICNSIISIGVYADDLSMAASFIFDPNVTTVIKVPVSVGYKVFVYC